MVWSVQRRRREKRSGQSPWSHFFTTHIYENIYISANFEERHQQNAFSTTAKEAFLFWDHGEAGTMPCASS
jgi:hypothetical protein